MTCVKIFRSMPYENSILTAIGSLYRIETCKDENLAYLFERLSNDIISIMRELRIDTVEIALLKCIILFDPGNKFK